MFISAKKVDAKAREVVEACGDMNIVVDKGGAVLGGEIVPAVVAAGVVVGSGLGTNRLLLDMSAEQIVRLVINKAVCMEETTYGDVHREKYGKAKAVAAEAFRKDLDENFEELDRILAQQSLDDEPEKSVE